MKEAAQLRGQVASLQCQVDNLQMQKESLMHLAFLPQGDGESWQYQDNTGDWAPFPASELVSQVFLSSPFQGDP